MLYTALVVLLCVLLLTTAGAAPDEAGMLARSLVSTGNTARLQQVFARAQQGGTLVVGTIGGSITQGAAASKPELRYPNRIAAWWQAQFPQAKIELVNAGIGATGSSYGVMRADRDLLSKKPDFIVVEYGVNDGNDRLSAESYEGLVRQILRQPNQPAVVLLFMMTREGRNAQEWQTKVGQHYDLPMVSYRDAVWGEIEAGRLAWTDVSPDTVHPNDWGHELAARFVTSLLAGVRGQQAGPVVTTLPEPLLSGLFDHTALFEAADLKPVSNNGWAYDAATKSWKSDQPGSVVEFELSGQRLYAAYYRLRGAMGKARVEVDGKPAAVLDAWFDQTWGGYRNTYMVGDGLTPGVHRVKLTLLEDKAPDSTGHEFRLLGLSAAGVTP